MSTNMSTKQFKPNLQETSQFIVEQQELSENMVIFPLISKQILQLRTSRHTKIQFQYQDSAQQSEQKVKMQYRSLKNPRFIDIAYKNQSSQDNFILKKFPNTDKIFKYSTQSPKILQKIFFNRPQTNVGTQYNWLGTSSVQVSYLEHSSSNHQPQFLSKVCQQLKFMILDKVCLDFRKVNFELGTKSFHTLQLILSRSKGLTDITLNFASRQQRVDDSCMALLSRTFFKKGNIKILELDFSKGNHVISTFSLKALAEAFAVNIELEKLVLKFGQGKLKISDTGFLCLAENLSQNAQLQHYELQINGGRNNITDNSLQYFVQKIEAGCYKQLQVLKFEFNNGENNITDEGIDLITQSINKLKMLGSFSLSAKGGNNEFSRGEIIIKKEIKKPTQNKNSLEIKGCLRNDWDVFNRGVVRAKPFSSSFQ